MRFFGPSAATERRVREFILQAPSASETAQSLAAKLKISRSSCRQVLEGLVDEGLVRRREFADIQPIYCRYPT